MQRTINNSAGRQLGPNVLRRTAAAPCTPQMRASAGRWQHIPRSATTSCPAAQRGATLQLQRWSAWLFNGERPIQSEQSSATSESLKRAVPLQSGLLLGCIRGQGWRDAPRRGAGSRPPSRPEAKRRAPHCRRRPRPTSASRTAGCPPLRRSCTAQLAMLVPP